MSDEQTRLTDLKTAVARFAEARGWGRLHDPKNLAIALAVEVAEFAEFFQWLTPEESYAFVQNPENKARIEQEVADIMIYLLTICTTFSIDLSTALTEKLIMNAQKYPEPDCDTDTSAS